MEETKVREVEYIEPRTLEEMEQGKGVVVTIILSKGFGFIRDENGKEIFFHAMSVCNPTYEELKEGQEVEYMIKETPRGPKAIGVVVI